MAFDWEAAAKANNKRAYSKLTKEDIVQYCVEHGKTEWLTATVDKMAKQDAEKKAENAKARKAGMLTLRKLFLAEVIGLKAAAPVQKNKGTFADSIKALIAEYEKGEA